jgi:hypothetical protein
MKLLYESGLSADGALAKRAKITFVFLEIAIRYIPQTHRADAMAEMSAALMDQVQEWDEESTHGL